MTLLYLTFSIPVLAQPSRVGERPPTFSVGGQFAARTSEGTEVDLSPVASWSPLTWWQWGAGMVYGYSDKGYRENGAQHTWGARTFMRITPFEKLPFLHMGYTYMDDGGHRTLGTVDGSSVWLGLGHRFEMKGKGSMSLTLAKGFYLPDLGPIGGPTDWSVRAGIQTPLRSGRKNGKGRRHHYRRTVEKDTTRISDRPFSERLVLAGGLRGGLPMGRMPSIGTVGGDDATDTTGTLDADRVSTALSRTVLSGTVMYEILKGVHLGAGTDIAYLQDSSNVGLDLGLRGLLRYTPDEGMPYLQFSYGGTWTRKDTLRDRKKWEGDWRLGAGYVLRLSEGMGLDLSLSRSLENGAGDPWRLGIGIQGDLGGGFEGVPDMTALSRHLMAPIHRLLGRASLEGGLSISGDDPRRVTVAPMFNFPLDSTWSVGIGISYSFSQDSLDLGNRRDERYGGNLYLRFLPVERWPYLQAEYRGTYIGDDITDKDIAGMTRGIVSSVMFGTGYKVRISKSGEVGITVLRDLTFQKGKGIGSTPWVVRTTLSTRLVKSSAKYTGVPGKSPPIERPKTHFLFGDLLKVEGNVGISLGEQTRVDLSPLFSYDIGRSWSIGLGPTYQYQEDSRQDISASVFGGRAFTRYRPREGFPYLQAELESLKGQALENLPRRWYTTGLIGAGADMPIGQRAALTVTALWDLTWQRGGRSLRDSPWVARMGLRI